MYAHGRSCGALPVPGYRCCPQWRWRAQSACARGCGAAGPWAAADFPWAVPLTILGLLDNRRVAQTRGALTQEVRVELGCQYVRNSNGTEGGVQCWRGYTRGENGRTSTSHSEADEGAKGVMPAHTNIEKESTAPTRVPTPPKNTRSPLESAKMPVPDPLNYSMVTSEVSL